MDVVFHGIVLFLIADFISGLVHWAEDTYAYPGMLWGILDNSIVEPNIYHHKNPSRMAQDSYLSINGVSILLTSIIALILWVSVQGTMDMYIVLAMMSQLNQIHAWAHTTNPPGWVKVLQNIGIFQSLKHHGIHHRKPYDTKYCILSNFVNPVLDRLGFWRVLECLIYQSGISVKRGSPLRNGF